MNPEGKTIPCGKTGEPWYFLEEMYPGYGNLVARDIASREVLRICELGLGVDGGMQVYLDMTHLPEKTLHKVESVLEIYRKFTGEDPKKVPMKIFPAVHYSMGGAWVDWPAADDPDRQTRFRQMSNIPGCFIVGESEFQYHGANRLGANSLVACIFAGLVAGNEVPRYHDALKTSYTSLPGKIYSDALAHEESFKHDLLTRDGPENVHRLHDEMADLMIRTMTVKRSNAELDKTIEKLKELRERYQHISLDDRGSLMNQTYTFANQFGPMLELALAMTVSARARDESRGAHYKAEFPERDDQHWLKTTIAEYTPEGPKIKYKKVNIRHLKPIPRDYVHAKKINPTLDDIPVKLDLPL